MSKPKPARLLLPLALFFALAQAAAAQAPLDTRRELSQLPDAQAVLFINARRIVNEMLPKMMTPAEYRKMLADAQKVGFDARGLEYVALVGRLAASPAPGDFPEVAVVVMGNFSADALLALGRVVAGSQNIRPRSETYGSKTLEIIDLESLGVKAEAGGEGAGGAQNKSGLPYKELAVTALDANTLVAGVPSYVRSAVDAAGGTGALRASLADLAAHDPNALWSFTMEMPPNLAEYLRKSGAPTNAEADQMIGWVKQVSLANGMDALNYTLSAAVLTDAPEHASAFSGMVRMGLLAAQAALSQQAAKQTPKDKDYAQTRAGLAALKTFVNRTEGNRLMLSVSVPQKTVADLVRSEMSKSKTTKAAPRAGRRPGRARRR